MKVPYDPDFDSPRRMNGSLNGLKPDIAFWFGCTVGVLLMSVVGALLLYFL